MSKWKVSKHYDPPCKYPWEVDGPDGQLSDVFETWAEAIEHTMAASHEKDPCCEECLAWATGADVDEQTKRAVYAGLHKRCY